MIRWGDLAAARPDLAQAGREILYQVGVGLGYVATVRRDGGPRVHPMCPLIDEPDRQGIYAFIVRGPKLDDLHRDGRYALHTYPRPDDEDAFYMTGRVRLVDDAAVLPVIRKQFLDERSMEPPPDWEEQDVFEFLIARCMLTRTTGHGDPHPQHTVWVAPR